MTKVVIDKEEFDEMLEHIRYTKEKYDDKIGSPYDDYYNEDLDNFMCDFLDILWFFEKVEGSNE